MINVSLFLRGSLLAVVGVVATTLVWVAILDARLIPDATAGQPDVDPQVAQTSPTEGAGPLQSSNPLQDSGPLQGAEPLQGTGPLQSGIPLQDVLPLPPDSGALENSSPSDIALLTEVPNIPLIPAELTPTQVVGLTSGDPILMNQLIGQLLGGSTNPAVIQQIVNVVTAGPGVPGSPILVAIAPTGGTVPVTTNGTPSTTPDTSPLPPAVLPPTTYVSNQ